MIESPSAGKSTITNLNGRLEVSIPARRNWFVIIFYSVWLGGWFMGEKSTISEVIKADSPSDIDFFLLFWTLGWTFAGAFIIYSIIWQLFGKEILSIDRGALNLRKTALTIGSHKQYLIKDISNFSIDQNYNTSLFGGGRTNYSGFFNQGKIKFDYGLKTIRFGESIQEAEAKYILSLLRQNRHFVDGNFPADKNLIS